MYIEIEKDAQSFFDSCDAPQYTIGLLQRRRGAVAAL